MSEFLVLFACLNNTGCQETSSQYYIHNPEFKEFIYRQEANINKALGTTITQYGGPIFMAASGRDATARLSTNFYLTLQKTQTIVLFKKEF